ncbi:sulfite reductase (NADPH) flavoprotein alpha-component [Glaciecola punicea ACAM 611]|uniref:Sulfite reductase [NADPH] flavoprotein alpha-component n=1 Tax=Glaciecola punicea ACAM 611 TaxID=1121923 RepID=H5TD76_9ALTE|nr:assimilatory sulfite reductase (NADPH) flavoprotein subunit [Glaciecola punicea]GAB56253.1 sulfite reductase (NADPH) flavoprotein alpha-component [Glaciecola punicea ACAM 611]
MNQQNDNSSSQALNDVQLTALSRAVSGFSEDQLIWASGYLSGLSAHARHSVLDVSGALVQAEQPMLTVLYGTQTGNTKHEAQAFSNHIASKGAKTKLVNMSDYKPRKIKDETHLVVFVSTHGEGDAPDAAIELYEFLASKKAPRLTNLSYAIVGLGDTSYEFFCQTGKDFDSRLAALGARPIIARLDCDVDYNDDIASWSQSVTSLLIASLSPAEAANTLNNIPVNQQEKLPPENKYSKQNPFTAALLSCVKITGRGSVKDIQHAEISLEGSNLQYLPGDSLGVYFTNDGALAERVIRATGTTADALVTIKGETVSLKTALIEKRELTLSYPGFVKAYLAATKDAGLQAILDDKPALRTFLEERQIVDIVEQFPNTITAQDLIDALRPISPRLYSIASSQSEVDDEVHLTVAHIDYQAFGSRHQGGASGFLATRLDEGAKMKVFVENNMNFRLPTNPDTPIIMIGPGTGIAPFRAFMQEREALGAAGKNWLFFGNPSFTQDFLYQVEWQRYLKEGLLSKISLAFSRDQANKIYVQDRLLENGKEVYEWLEQGAHFYVCGDAMHMAKDVEKALLNIIQTHGSKSEQEAKHYVVDMRKTKRYQKDVY